MNKSGYKSKKKKKSSQSCKLLSPRVIELKGATLKFGASTYAASTFLAPPVWTDSPCIRQRFPKCVRTLSEDPRHCKSAVTVRCDLRLSLCGCLHWRSGSAGGQAVGVLPSRGGGTAQCCLLLPSLPLRPHSRKRPVSPENASDETVRFRFIKSERPGAHLFSILMTRWKVHKAVTHAEGRTPLKGQLCEGLGLPLPRISHLCPGRLVGRGRTLR